MKKGVLVLCIILLASCTKPLATAKVAKDVRYLDRDYAASANEVYYAVRWALSEVKMPVANENLSEGVITTAWLPVKSDSHYIEVFGRPDYGVTNSYHQLEVQVIPQGGRTEVKVGSRTKTIVVGLTSSGVMERRVLDGVGDYLRRNEPSVTNLGIDESR